MSNKELMKCDNCRCLEIEHLQNEFWLGVDTSRQICNNPLEEYDMLEMQLTSYMSSMFDETVVNDCSNCKSKFRVINSKKYFDRIDNITKSSNLDKENKLIQIYKIEDEYFDEVGFKKNT